MGGSASVGRVRSRWEGPLALGGRDGRLARPGRPSGHSRTAGEMRLFKKGFGAANGPEACPDPSTSSGQAWRAARPYQPFAMRKAAAAKQREAGQESSYPEDCPDGRAARPYH